MFSCSQAVITGRLAAPLSNVMSVLVLSVINVFVDWSDSPEWTQYPLISDEMPV